VIVKNYVSAEASTNEPRIDSLIFGPDEDAVVFNDQLPLEVATYETFFFRHVLFLSSDKFIVV
jgi:hypothetical protein